MTYIQSEEVKEKSQPDEEKKAIRDLVKKINSVVECASNTYYLAHIIHVQGLSSEIACNPTNAEYNRLVGVDAEVVYNDITPFE